MLLVVPINAPLFDRDFVQLGFRSSAPKKCQNQDLDVFSQKPTKFSFEYVSMLKVVGNEKEGGSGKWQMTDIGLGLW
jgi:hypothetical protein